VTGFSPRFLRAVVAEIERCERRVDRLDERIENAHRQADKDRLSAERARWNRYERWLRENFLR
jgi:hypothetical protein